MRLDKKSFPQKSIKSFCYFKRLRKVGQPTILYICHPRHLILLFMTFIPGGAQKCPLPSFRLFTKSMLAPITISPPSKYIRDKRKKVSLNFLNKTTDFEGNNTVENILSKIFYQKRKFYQLENSLFFVSENLND